jgi:xanthine dehydrogenase molybdenum-binding subunit
VVETNDPFGPFGAKGIGEPGSVPTAPAIANAIYDAVGVRIKDLPITPEKVLAALKEKTNPK